MSTLDQIRHGFHHAWDSLAEGWHALRHRAAHALTRFTPPHTAGMGTATDQFLRSTSHWGILAAELKETSEQILVRLEAPGMDPENFEIEVSDDILVIRGHKHIEHEAAEGRYYLLERAYGAFERAFRLPAEVDQNKARAQYRRGVLTVSLPKSSRKTSRRVTISSA